TGTTSANAIQANEGEREYSENDVVDRRVRIRRDCSEHVGAFDASGRHPGEEARVEEVLRHRKGERKRDDCQLKSPFSERGQTDDHRDRGSGDRDERKCQSQVETPVLRRLSAERGTEREEADLSQGDLAGPACEYDQRESEDRVDDQRRGL